MVDDFLFDVYRRRCEIQRFVRFFAFLNYREGPGPEKTMAEISEWPLGLAW